MPEPLILIYWDADVFLSYINGIADRLPHLDAFLEKSGKDHQLITSTVSIVEVAFAKVEQDGKMLDQEVERKLNRLWSFNSPVKLVDFYSLIGDGAKDLMRHGISQSWQLKPMDAIHLSTARLLRAKEFHTYSNDLHRWESYTGLKIGPPLTSAPRLPFT